MDPGRVARAVKPHDQRLARLHNTSDRVVSQCLRYFDAILSVPRLRRLVGRPGCSPSENFGVKCPKMECQPVERQACCRETLSQACGQTGVVGFVAFVSC